MTEEETNQKNKQDLIDLNARLNPQQRTLALEMGRMVQNSGLFTDIQLALNPQGEISFLIVPRWVFKDMILETDDPKLKDDYCYSFTLEKDQDYMSNPEIFRFANHMMMQLLVEYLKGNREIIKENTPSAVEPPKPKSNLILPQEPSIILPK